jgi:integrase
MKPKGKHPQNSLSAVKLKSLSKPGRYGDGNGLYLVVAPSGSKRWMLRTVIHGKRRDVGLGSSRLVTLAEAREAALKFRKLARDGGDPVSERRKAQAVIPSFREAAEQVHAQHSGAWRNAKHSKQWVAILTEYAFPKIGHLRVDRIETRDILEVLSVIWLEKPETARRVKQRIGAVLDWAIASSYRTSGNPVNAVAKGLPRQPDRKGHHEALPYRQIPEFLVQLRASSVSELGKLAFELLILTAARTGEILKSEWEEFDLERKIWTIPGERMKAGRSHRVPLSARAIEILAQARELGTGSTYVFPGRQGTRPLSDLVFLMALRRMQLDITAHGFRSCFSDWAAERTNFPREVCEMVLAHTIKNKVEAAYNRSDLFEKRAELMATWADYVCGQGGPGHSVSSRRAQLKEAIIDNCILETDEQLKETIRWAMAESEKLEAEWPQGGRRDKELLEHWKVHRPQMMARLSACRERRKHSLTP